MSSDVRDRSVWGSKLKEWLKVCFFTGKNSIFIPGNLSEKTGNMELIINATL
jgi:hypothetical protein